MYCFPRSIQIDFLNSEQNVFLNGKLKLLISDVTALLDTLTARQLQNLEKHKYSCSGVSLLEPLYKPWWEFAITLCPLWIAPNLITLMGLIVNCTGFLLMAYYSQGL